MVSRCTRLPCTFLIVIWRGTLADNSKILHFRKFSFADRQYKDLEGEEISSFRKFGESQYQLDLGQIEAAFHRAFQRDMVRIYANI